jgi:hypothetical protein
MADHPTAQTTDHPTDRAGGRVAHWLGVVFYGGVAAVALAGQTTAATAWLGWPVEFALPAVGLLELGGITLAARSDYRRGLGERAVAARILSTAVAVFAVAFNWAGHTDHLQGGFFAGMSALGYAVWLINAGDRRRDQLRRTNRLLSPPPAYGLLQWLRHPRITRRAHVLATADSSLGLHESLITAEAQIREEQRNATIARLLKRKLAKDKDPMAADIAVAVYDLDEIAQRIRGEADYDGLAALIAVDLDPRKVLGDQGKPTVRKPVDRPSPDRAETPKATTSSDRNQAATRPATKPTDRPAPRVTGRPTVRPGERAAVANARELRKAFPTTVDLPTSERQVRVRMGWSKERAQAAIAAYRAGEDLGDAEEEHPASRELTEAQ